MSGTREPFDPFLTKLLAAAGGKASAPIEDIKNGIEKIKTALHLARKWEEGIFDGFAALTRTVDQIIQEQPSVNDDSIKSQGAPLDFLSTENGKKLLASAAEKVEEMASKVPCDFQLSPTTSSPSSVSKEIPMNEEEFQCMAEKITAPDPGLTNLNIVYDYLDPQLKRCFLYFSAFPENKVIRRRIMIYWWIGEGLVAPTSNGRTAEHVGEECFKMLIWSNLIQPIYQKHSKTAKYCKIYPWARQMLVSKAEEYPENFFTFDQQDRPTFNSMQCERACLVAKEEKDQVAVTVKSKPNELRSLFNLSAQYLSCNKDQLASLKAIAALQLGRWQYLSRHHIEFTDTKFLEALQFLKGLRYLSLQGISRIIDLPETIAGLTNLLILDLRSCHNLENVTPAVTSINSLTHLDVSECYLLDKMPQGIGSMTNLQVLKGFVVASTRSRDPCRLSELTQLTKLWKLSIRIGSEVHIGEDLSELSKIESLLSLKITWGQMKSSPMKIREPKTMKGSAPLEITELKTSSNKTMKRSPPSQITELKTSRNKTMKGSGSMKESMVLAFSLLKLEKLVLECVPDEDSMSWLKPGGFRGLKRLYIAGGKLRKLSTVTENDGWNVEILRLKFLKELKLEWVDLKMKLRQLRCAQIYECPNILYSPSGFDDKGYWVRNDEDASSSSMAGTIAPV
ncbi:disease resistance RPP13-like protein 4 [Magnolia sinica]|uniref:disease resistance RPP13-like protein 4 n=1 Tax=Magnolia sinica TaxID=86752 RepID=UPI002659520B|nr:disease resistance RPP13-like protein 4 [Magnolia sinica]XP_058114677.1 disease resistance RPP13-like protein 4 [Magnolia sinica]XP_058114678.1 disease resistance RPP13-like protein 4 [Magnolia sinica]